VTPSAGGAQLYNSKRRALEVAIRRILGLDVTAGPRLIVLLIGNGASDTNLKGRPPSAHKALERALADVPNAVLLRTGEAGTTMVRLLHRAGGRHSGASGAWAQPAAGGVRPQAGTHDRSPRPTAWSLAQAHATIN